MPRKQPAAPQTSSEVALDGNESYLDNFLNSVIDEANLPGELKRYLGQLRELDTQSQELFERMQRLSKNHIAKAKRSVQDGREPDEEYLAKARRTYRELVDIDEEKVSLAEQMHVEVTKHFSHCSSELRKFEEELKEKGQLKTPQMKTQLARQDSASNDADAAGAGSSFAAAGRRGRQGSIGGTGSGVQPEQPTSANSHKRGRGRKVSFKEAERQRAVAEAMAEERVAPPPSMQGFHYNDSELPVAPREECNLPLCGAVPAAPDYMIPDGSKVSTNPAVPLSLVPAVPLSLVPSSRCSRALWRAPPRRWHAHLITQPSLLIPLDGSPHHASAPLDADTGGSLFSLRSLVPPSQVCAKPPSNKMQPQDWILATVLRYSPATSKYTILDEDDADADPWAESSAREHLVSRRMVMPLPLTEPSMYTPYNEFPRGQWILALYPDTTCFYKAMVHTPPSEMAGGPPKDYLVEFEDESEESGRSAPMRVPTKYILRMPV